MGLRTAFEEGCFQNNECRILIVRLGTKAKPSQPYAALCLTPIAPGIGARMVEREYKDMNCEAPNQALERNFRITSAPKKTGACVIRSSLSAALEEGLTDEQERFL